jgi:hypothetical protein
MPRLILTCDDKNPPGSEKEKEKRDEKKGIMCGRLWQGPSNENPLLTCGVT